jgi:hypothetical protein
LPHAPGDPSGASVDAALTAAKRRRVPHHPGPLAPRSLVGLRRVGGASNDAGEGAASAQAQTETRRPGKTLSFGNVAAAVRETSDTSICSSRAQAGAHMSLEPEDVPDRGGFSCFTGVVGGLQEAHDLRRSSPASNGPAVEGRSTRRWALPK